MDPGAEHDSKVSVGDTKRGWTSVGALALGAFIIVMTETLPVGLLPDMADGFDVSVSAAGLMVLAPGISSAVSAPLFFLHSGALNRRSLILGLVLAVFVSNSVVAIAPNFVVVLIARTLFGATLGGFWTVVSPIGPKLVGAASGTRAITIIAAGISGGTVVGLPAGQFLGNHIGWRLTFAVAASATLLVWAVQVLALPSIAPDKGTRIEDLSAVLRRPLARLAMAAGAMAFIAQFTAWTYITPFLLDRTQLPSPVISTLYVAYGVAGIVGSIVAGSLFKRGVAMTFAGAAAAVATLVVSIAWTGTWALWAGILFVLWGLCWGIVNPGTLVWMLETSPEAPEAASAINVTNLQVALAAGSGLGAILVSSNGLRTTFFVGGLLMFASAAFAFSAARSASVRQSPDLLAPAAGRARSDSPEPSSMD
jgi:predicted MFS family arabinose efflux permease